MEITETKFDVIVGRCEGGNLLFPKHAGFAFKRAEEPYYTVKLHMFPGVTYFLSKNHGDNPNYTLFSKAVKSDEGAKFQNPVGAARLRDDLKTHLEIRFNLIERRIYMSLFPAQS